MRFLDGRLGKASDPQVPSRQSAGRLSAVVEDKQLAVANIATMMLGSQLLETLLLALSNVRLTYLT
ncbi:hypothetical protein [Novipirellula artificiosorum]|uniref:hypothetical protein n=1 Tax=Novipirellula artificiosorum TaxID=2528016 RepID=UPI0011B6C87A|nr:hypothetical protein [Novipirellula artificiosorum]